MDANVRTVRFLDQQGAEDLYRCLDNGRIYVRQRCGKDHVRWLTSIKWRSGYEASGHMRNGMIIKVVDGEERILFEERIVKSEDFCDTVAEKQGPFYDEALKHQANLVGAQATLKSYNDWKTWMMRAARKHGFTGYSDNWCYAEVEYGEVKLLFRFDCLGTSVYCTVQEAVHKVSGQKWKCVEIRDRSKLTVLEICGYEFQEE